VKHDEKTNFRDAIARLLRERRVDWFDSAVEDKVMEVKMILLKKLPAHLTTLSCALDAVGVSSKHPAGPLPEGAKLQYI
jgi:hypothetical protein